MKALTVYQPWASLIMIGAKPYEFRGWPPPRWLVGKRLVIHASVRPIRIQEVRELIHRLHIGAGRSPCLYPDKALPLLGKVLEDPSSLPLGHGLGTAVVGPGKRGDECANEFGSYAGNDSDREGTFNWGWPLSDIRFFEPPIACRGLQSLWTWPHEVPA